MPRFGKVYQRRPALTPSEEEAAYEIEIEQWDKDCGMWDEFFESKRKEEEDERNEANSARRVVPPEEPEPEEEPEEEEPEEEEEEEEDPEEDPEEEDPEEEKEYTPDTPSHTPAPSGYHYSPANSRSTAPQQSIQPNPPNVYANQVHYRDPYFPPAMMRQELQQLEDHMAHRFGPTERLSRRHDHEIDFLHYQIDNLQQDVNTLCEVNEEMSRGYRRPVRGNKGSRQGSRGHGGQF